MLTTKHRAQASAMNASTTVGLVRAAPPAAATKPQTLSMASQKKKWRGSFPAGGRMLLRLLFIMALGVEGFVAPFAARARRGRFRLGGWSRLGCDSQLRHEQLFLLQGKTHLERRGHVLPGHERRVRLAC